MTVNRRFIRAAATAMCVAALTAGATAPTTAAPADGSGRGPGYSFAVIGDTPYGDEALARFPGQIDSMNRDRSLRFVTHVGDIKAGSQRCDTEYFRTIRNDFDRFAMPLVFTPGDNDWTDCHRENNGAYNPLERMSVLREVFYDRPGHTLGGKNVHLDSRVRDGYPENSTFEQKGLSFAVINVQGSNNGLLPWTGLGLTGPTPEQLAEERARTRSNVATVQEAFATAEQKHRRAVVIMTQADMFDPHATDATAQTQSGFRETVDEISRLSREFGKPVYLINGDSHEFVDDRPLAAGSRWLGVYGQTPVSNLHRITVDGAQDATNYLKFTVNEPAAKGASGQTPGTENVLSYERVTFR